MAVEPVFVPEAEQDVADAYGWYEKRRHGLGEEFLSCIDAGIQSICRMPELHIKVHHDYRRFPYAIFYADEQGAVTVYGVFHTSREPKKWRERLP